MCMALGAAKLQARFEDPRQVLGNRLRGIYRFLADFGGRLFPDDYFADLSAPRGAPMYPPRSGEGLEVISLGPMADLDSKDEGDNSMPSELTLVLRRTGRGVGGPA